MSKIVLRNVQLINWYGFTNTVVPVAENLTLISGENDRPEDVKLLQQKLSGMLCHVNLIPLNEVEETGFSGSSRKRAEEIASQLERAGIPATVRRELGSEIDGACGQLRLKEKTFENQSV